jgi:hypothetical protein
MDTFLLFFVALIVAFIIGFVVVKLGGDKDSPASPTESHDESVTGTEDGEPAIPGYPTGSRPGGPGAEAMNPEVPGGPVAGGSDATDDEAAGTSDALPPSQAAHKDLGDHG